MAQVGGKFAAIERSLLRGDKFSDIGYPALCLYVWMKDALFDDDNNCAYTSATRVAYGPQGALAYGMPKGTYYLALGRLLRRGVISEVEPGGHGRKPVYDLTAWRRNGD
jgi:hypothetical protein